LHGKQVSIRTDIVAGVDSLRPIDIAIAMVLAYAGYFTTNSEWLEDVLLAVASVMLAWIIFDSRFFGGSSGGSSDAGPPEPPKRTGT
jgi:hypothetical protein